MKINTRSGFTIVELLIVVVVIAILAMLVITAYSGAQAKARNSQTATAIAAYEKALRLYATDKQEYPITTGYVCLGEGYGDYNSDGSAGDCWHLDNPVKENATFNTALKPYLGRSIANPSMQVLQASFKQVGAILIVDNGLTVNGTAHPWILAYTIEGKNAKCPLKNTLSFAPSGWPNFSTTSPASGYTEAYGDVGVGCFKPLPDPTKS